MRVDKKLMKLARLLKEERQPLLGLDISDKLGWHVATTYGRLKRLATRPRPVIKIIIVEDRKMFYHILTAGKRARYD